MLYVALRGGASFLALRGSYLGGYVMRAVGLLGRWNDLTTDSRMIREDSHRFAPAGRWWGQYVDIRGTDINSLYLTLILFGTRTDKKSFFDADFAGDADRDGKIRSTKSEIRNKARSTKVQMIETRADGTADYADYADSGCGWVCVPFVCRWIVEVLGVVFCAARLLFGLVRVGAVGLVGWGNEF